MDCANAFNSHGTLDGGLNACIQKGLQLSSFETGVICSWLICELALSNKDQFLMLNNVTLPFPLAKASESNALSCQTPKPGTLLSV
jgi:hypothetical protein